MSGRGKGVDPPLPAGSGGADARPAEGGACGETGDQTDQESRSASHRAATSVIAMASIESVTLEVADPTAVNRFYTVAFGLGTQVRLRASEAPTTGFRGFTLSLTDGTIWKVATSAKKDTGPATRQIDQIVLLLGVADVAASKRFYVDRGLAAAKSFGRKYIEFATPSSPVKLAPYRRRALAKTPASVPKAPDRTGSCWQRCRALHDPDGFAWATAYGRERLPRARPRHRARASQRLPRHARCSRTSMKGVLSCVTPRGCAHSPRRSG